MKKFYITFDESDKDYLKNSDASAHLVNIVEAQSIDEVHTKVYKKIRSSDRRQIRVKPFKIKAIRELSE